MAASDEIRKLLGQILELVSDAARKSDVSGVARLSQAAAECEGIATRVSELETLLGEVTARAANGNREDAGRSRANREVALAPVFAGANGSGALRQGRSARTESQARARAAREAFVTALRSRGIQMSGHRKSYVVNGAARMEIPFANELTNLPNKWFLGMSERPVDLVVLLCRSNNQDRAVILTKDDLRKCWNILTRHRGQMKFHVTRSGTSFMLDLPGGSRLDLTRNVDNLEAIRGA